jgi:hypothetical protein
MCSRGGGYVQARGLEVLGVMEVLRVMMRDLMCLALISLSWLAHRGVMWLGIRELLNRSELLAVEHKVG